MPPKGRLFGSRRTCRAAAAARQRLTKSQPVALCPIWTHLNDGISESDTALLIRSYFLGASNLFIDVGVTGTLAEGMLLSSSSPNRSARQYRAPTWALVMGEQNTEKLEALRKDVVELVTEHWQEHGKAYLLSRLGLTLVRRGFNLQATLAGRKLAAYISTELADVLRVVSPPSNSLKSGVVPVTADLSGGLEALFTAPTPLADGDGQIPSLVPAFWAAFTRPIPPDRVRTLSLAPRVQFQDVSVAAATQSGKKVVGPEFIVSPGAHGNGTYKAAVYSSIQRWLSSNDVELAAVLASSPSSAGVTVQSRGESGSLLERLTSALTHEELRRISLPLDIVARLAKM